MNARQLFFFAALPAVMFFSCGEKGGQGPTAERDIFYQITANDPVKTEEAYRGLKDPGIRNKDGRTPLMEAINQDHTEIARLLLALGAPVNVFDSSSSTPLLLAVRNRDTALVKLLLEAKADIAAIDKNGDNAVRIAVSNRRTDTEIIDILVKAGADKALVTDLPAEKITVVREQRIITREEIREDTKKKIKEEIKAELNRENDTGVLIKELNDSVSGFMEEARQAFRLIGERLNGLQDQLKENAKSQAANQSGVRDLSDVINDMEQTDQKDK
jgi:hypothetical protein